MKTKTGFGTILALLIIAGAVLIEKGETRSLAPSVGKLKVVTTLFPLYDFAGQVGGDRVTVASLLPPGVEPHAFEPKPSDMAKIMKADIFVYTGKFMEPWADDIIKGSGGTKTVVVDASRGVSLMPAVMPVHDEPAGALDPHIWLDFENAKKIVENIALGFITRDPEGADFYRRRSRDYQEKLTALDEDYKTSLANCRNREIIYGGHYAFGYMARRYGLKYLAAQGLSPDAEPTAKDLIELVKQIRRNDIKYIFYEELTSPKIAETIAHETQAKLLILSPAQNPGKADFERQVSFLEIMKKNLANLRKGLQCSN